MLLPALPPLHKALPLPLPTLPLRALLLLRTLPRLPPTLPSPLSTLPRSKAAARRRADAKGHRKVAFLFGSRTLATRQTSSQGVPSSGSATLSSSAPQPPAAASAASASSGRLFCRLKCAPTMR